MKSVTIALVIAAAVSLSALGSLKLGSATPLPLGWSAAGEGVAPTSLPAATLVARDAR